MGRAEGDERAMRFTYDAESDVLMIVLHPWSQVAHTVEVDDDRHVDLDGFDRVVQIEVLWASLGVELEDIIDRFDLKDFKDFLGSVAEAQPSFRPVIPA